MSALCAVIQEAAQVMNPSELTAHEYVQPCEYISQLTAHECVLCIEPINTHQSACYRLHVGQFFDQKF